jgi:phasin family protein
VLQETLREIGDMAQSFRTPGNPQELLSKQADFARRSFEAAVKNASETAEIVKKSGQESIDILRERIRESVQEIRSGFEDSK